MASFLSNPKWEAAAEGAPSENASVQLVSLQWRVSTALHHAVQLHFPAVLKHFNELVAWVPTEKHSMHQNAQVELSWVADLSAGLIKRADRRPRFPSYIFIIYCKLRNNV